MAAHHSHSPARANRRRRLAGFTLVELLVTLAVLSILVAVAVPSFSSFISKNRLRSAVDALTLDLAFARSEAVKRVRPVLLCKSSNQTSCSSTASDSWAQGWLVYVDQDGDNALDANESVISARPKLTPSVSITPADNFKNYLAYRPDGTSNTFGSFQVALNGGDETLKPRLICVAITGRTQALQGGESCT